MRAYATKLLRISAPEHLADNLAEKLTGSQPRHSVSATLAGLVAVQPVPIDTCEVHEKTGALTIREPVDPLAPDIDIVTEAELEAAEHSYRPIHQSSEHSQHQSTHAKGEDRHAD